MFDAIAMLSALGDAHSGGRTSLNGGFDAFVTDASLSRIRVSYTMPAFPKPDEWVHLALSWDETRGIRFYVNGVLAAIAADVRSPL